MEEIFPTLKLPAGALLEVPEAAISAHLREITHRQRLYPPGEDEIIASLWQATAEELKRGTPFASIVRDFARYKYKTRKEPDVKPSEDIGALRASIGTFLDRHPEHQFPYDDYADPARWNEPFRHIEEVILSGNSVQSDPDDSETLVFNLMGRKVQTSIAERYKLVELTMQMLRSRFPEGVRWLDIGAGLMEGNRQMLLKDHYQFEPIILSQSSGDYDSTLSAKANRLQQLPSIVRECVCVDIMPMYRPGTQVLDPKIVEWVKGGLRPSSERLKPKFMSKFEALISTKVPNIKFIEADFTKPQDLEAFDAQVGDEHFDVISAITTLHQMSLERQSALIAAAKARLKPGGVLMVQDFMYGHGNNPRVLIPYKYWHEVGGRYRTYIYDSLNPRGVFQEIFLSQDSRVKKTLPGMGKLVVGHSLESSRDLLLHA